MKRISLSLKRCLSITLCLSVVISFASMSGCKNETGQRSDATTTANYDNEHEHSHDHPPHDGTVVDWGGGKYHMEFTVNHDLQQATVYVLSDDVKSPMPINADEISLAIIDPKFQVVLKAEPFEGESEGKSSRFVGKHENLGIVKEYEGKIFGTVEGKPYSGDFKEVPHDH